jgi:hypothetical protein
MNHRIWLWSVAVLATVLLAGSVEAKRNKGEAKAEAKATHATLIAELHQIMGLLHQAKHDYEGHRAAAMEQVHKAIEALEHDMHHHNKTKPGTPGAAAHHAKPGNSNKEPQAESDLQLKEAITGLQAVHGQLASLPKGPKHAHAEEHIHKAIHDLHVALKIK